VYVEYEFFFILTGLFSLIWYRFSLIAKHSHILNIPNYLPSYPMSPLKCTEY